VSAVFHRRGRRLEAAAGADPRGTVRLVSTGNESKSKRGRTVELHVISEQRDSFRANRPGDVLHGRLPARRETVARLRKP
jgi:hypothetical protein